jgi:hypothetical protein
MKLIVHIFIFVIAPAQNILLKLAPASPCHIYLKLDYFPANGRK